MEENLLKSNFLGRDGFRWWVGQIPPLSAMGKQPRGEGWGNRYKVRIMGYHPESAVELPDNQLPWAQVMLPPTAGTGAGGISQDIKLQEGDVVFGFFMDGDNAQTPIIIGALGRSRYIVNQKDKKPFTPFSGTNDLIKKADGKTRAKGGGEETNEQHSSSAQNPAALPTGKTAEGTVSVSDAVGDNVKLADKKPSTLDKISNALNNFLRDYQKYSDAIQNDIEWARDWLKQEIDYRVEQLENIVAGMVGGAVTAVMDKLIPLIKAGLKILYGTVYGLVFAATLNPTTANKAGELAEKALIPVIVELEERIPCLIESIIKSLGNVIRQMLYAIVDNIANFVSCVAEQFMGSIMNSIIGQIATGLQSAISGLSKILDYVGGFNTEDFLRSVGEAFLGMLGLPKCKDDDADDDIKDWIVGAGPKAPNLSNIDGILEVANNAFAISAEKQGTENPVEGVGEIVGAFDIFNQGISQPDFTGISDCFAGFPQFCGPPKINIFGGGGSGASAVPLFGNITQAANGLTGGIISVKMTNPGSNYVYPPFVEIVDNCNQGYGAIARSIISDGQVTGIYVVSPGENYPAEEQPYVVDSVSVLDPGSGYSDGDTITDDQGNDYDVQISNGYIVKVTPLNNGVITSLPVLTINSDTGVGAVLKPSLDIPDFQGEVKQVIDCITK